MRPKQRFLDALNFCKPQDYVAFMELEFQISKEYVGRELLLGNDFARLSSREKDIAQHTNAQILIDVMQKAGHDACKELGGYWEAAPGHPAYMWLPTFEDRLEFVRVFKQEAGEEYFMFGNLGATMSIPTGEQLYSYIENLFEHPEKIHEQSESLLCQAIEDGVRLIEAGCDGIINASDIAFNTGTFISPEMLHEFYFPYFDRWVDATHKVGAIAMWHTDGNINAVFERAVHSKVDAIQCIDPLGGMDIVALKEKYDGRVTLVGNIDCSMLQLSSKEEVDTSIRQVIEGCKGSGGFVLSGCNAIFKGISAERYQWMVDARYHYGKEE